MPDEIDSIIEGLTEAQRRAVLCGLQESPEVFNLARKGLAWKVGDSLDLVTGHYKRGGWLLRPRGLAVRARLQERKDGH